MIAANAVVTTSTIAHSLFFIVVSPHTLEVPGVPVITVWTLDLLGLAIAA